MSQRASTARQDPFARTRDERHKLGVILKEIPGEHLINHAGTPFDKNPVLGRWLCDGEESSGRSHYPPLETQMAVFLSMW